MLATGTILQGRYRVASPLGQGGMAAVYRVWDMRLNAPLALKEMTPQPGLDAATLAQLRRQFEQEASVLANLSHPFLVDVTDYFEEGGNDYLLMKFVEGESLAGRFELVRLTHWSFPEMEEAFGFSLDQYLYFGGYPGAAPLAADRARWARYILDSLVETTVSRDILLMMFLDRFDPGTRQYLPQFRAISGGGVIDNPI